MNAAREFERLALLADRVRPRDRAEFVAKLDAAASAALAEAHDDCRRATIYTTWVQVRPAAPRAPMNSLHDSLPPRVVAAIGEAYMEELTQCPTKL